MGTASWEDEVGTPTKIEALKATKVRYAHGRVGKTRVGRDAPSVKAFTWWLEGAQLGNAVRLAQVELRHDGVCGRCARLLTVPESVDTGFGPHCAAELGVPWVRDDGSAAKLSDHPVAFILAGKARFTLTSKKTGQHFTYQVKKAKDGGKRPNSPWFVSILSGPDNGSDYQYIGCLWEEK